MSDKYITTKKVMAKKSMIARQKKRVLMHKLFYTRRLHFKTLLIKSSVNQKFYLSTILQKFPKNSSSVRLNRRCLISGRPKGVNQDFGLSRQVFREMAHQGLLPGVKKASW